MVQSVKPPPEIATAATSYDIALDTTYVNSPLSG